MNITPSALNFITRRPISHRGLHDKSKGILENCPQAFRAAIANNYAIECDIQLSQDGEAMVFHDFTLDRLTLGQGLVREKTAHALKFIAFKETTDSIPTLQDLFDLTHKQVPLIIEIKSAFDGDMLLTKRAIELAKNYKGEMAFMSFDPEIVTFLKIHAPHLIRGFVGQNAYIGGEWSKLTSAQKQAMANLQVAQMGEPHFLSWRIRDLPSAPVRAYKEKTGSPLICWTVRTQEERDHAKHHADQVTFEGYRA